MYRRMWVSDIDRAYASVLQAHDRVRSMRWLMADECCRCHTPSKSLSAPVPGVISRFLFVDPPPRRRPLALHAVVSGCCSYPAAHACRGCSWRSMQAVAVTTTAWPEGMHFTLSSAGSNSRVREIARGHRWLISCRVSGISLLGLAELRACCSLALDSLCARAVELSGLECHSTGDLGMTRRGPGLGLPKID